MNDKEDYVSHDQSLLLKELGFDLVCRSYYTNDYINSDPDDLRRETKLHRWTPPYNYNKIVGNTSAPTLWEAQKWLRKMGIDISINRGVGGKHGYSGYYYVMRRNNDILDERIQDLGRDEKLSYEEALSDAITSGLLWIKREITN